MGFFLSGWLRMAFLWSGSGATLWSNKRAMRSHNSVRVQSCGKTKAAALHRDVKDLRLKMQSLAASETAGKPLWRSPSHSHLMTMSRE
jgi:hypothetical protein